MYQADGDGSGRGTALADASLSNAKRFKNLSFLTLHAYAQYARTAMLRVKGDGGRLGSGKREH